MSVRLNGTSRSGTADDRNERLTLSKYMCVCVRERKLINQTVLNNKI